VVSDHKVAYALTDSLDHTGAFVAEYERRGR
jgi:hypothetical protein